MSDSRRSPRQAREAAKDADVEHARSLPLDRDGASEYAVRQWPVCRAEHSVRRAGREKQSEAMTAAGSLGQFLRMTSGIQDSPLLYIATRGYTRSLCPFRDTAPDIWPSVFSFF